MWIKCPENADNNNGPDITRRASESKAKDDTLKIALALLRLRDTLTVTRTF